MNQSNSTSNFAPNPHRRSHPNLQHLSLAPLTPRYPITPSDYDAYFDPDTSQLHTSSSLSHIAGMPNPEGVLSRPNSRDSSRVRNRKSKSSVSIQMTSNTPRGALTSEGFGYHVAGAANSHDRLRPSGTPRPEPTRSSPSWIMQTGMTLTEGSREYKGQSWLAKRASSTSLHSPHSQEYLDAEAWQPRSGRDTPIHSRRGSRDRRRSRKQLSMTPASGIAPSSEATSAREKGLDRSGTLPSPGSAFDYSAAGPEWTDPSTQAEIAAELDENLESEFDEAESYSNGDRYRDLDFAGQGAEEDEREIQRAVRARGFGLGRWVDGVVDVFLMMDGVDDEYEDDNNEKSDRGEPGAESTENRREPLRAVDKLTVSEGERDDIVSSEDEMEPAPQNPQNAWEDLSWFGRLVLRIAQS